MPPLYITCTPLPAINTLSLHDALPICPSMTESRWRSALRGTRHSMTLVGGPWGVLRIPRVPNPVTTFDCRSEEHTSELQSRGHIVCRLLLEKKNWNLNSSVLSLHAFLH